MRHMLRVDFAVKNEKPLSEITGNGHIYNYWIQYDDI